MVTGFVHFKGTADHVNTQSEKTLKWYFCTILLTILGGQMIDYCVSSLFMTEIQKQERGQV